jgi:hypothetical protein
MVFVSQTVMNLLEIFHERLKKNRSFPLAALLNRNDTTYNRIFDLNFVWCSDLPDGFAHHVPFKSRFFFSDPRLVGASMRAVSPGNAHLNCQTLRSLGCMCAEMRRKTFQLDIPNLPNFGCFSHVLLFFRPRIGL